MKNKPFIFLTCLAVLSFFQTIPVRAESPKSFCSLDHVGSCCAVSLSKSQAVQVRSAIDGIGTVDFLGIKNDGQALCDFYFAGEMQVPIRLTPGKNAQTLMGGDFALSIPSTGSSEKCALTLYFTNILNYGFFKSECVDGKFKVYP